MTTRPGISKYFIAIVPPSPILELGWKWKEYFKVEFDSRAALNSPPHITLHMPFEWKSEKESKLIDQLTQFSQTQNSLDLELSNFGCFPPRVIFIHVTEDPELMKLQAALTRFCQMELNLFNATRLDLPYHAHLTVAFRDLKKQVFPKAWESVKDLPFNHSFIVKALELLKHDGSRWKVLSQFPLVPEN